MATNWENLRFFLAVARTGNLTAAAKTLEVSQPTVGRRLQRLEAQIGARLFRRVDEKFCLTSIGETVLEQARQLEKTVVNIERLAGRGESAMAGAVRLATTDCLAYGWLIEAIAELREPFPGIEIEVVAGLDVVDIVRKEADIALRVGTTPSPALHAQRVGAVDFSLYASEAYLAAHPAPATPEHLAGHSVIESRGDLATLPQTVELKALTHGAHSLAFDSVLSQLQAVREGLGIALLPRYVAARDAQLLPVLPDAFRVTLDLWLVTHPDQLESARHALVWNHLVAGLERDEQMFRHPSPQCSSTA